MLHPPSHDPRYHVADVSKKPLDVGCLPPNAALPASPFLILPPYLPSSNIGLVRPTWQQHHQAWSTAGKKNDDESLPKHHQSTRATCPSPPTRSTQTSKQAKGAQPTSPETKPKVIPPVCTSAVAAEVPEKLMYLSDSCIKEAGKQSQETGKALPPWPVCERQASDAAAAVQSMPSSQVTAEILDTAEPSQGQWRPQLWRPVEEIPKDKELEAAVDAAAPAAPASCSSTTSDVEGDQLVSVASDVVDAAEDAWAAGIAGSLDASATDEYAFECSSSSNEAAAVGISPADRSDIPTKVVAASAVASAPGRNVGSAHWFGSVLGSWQDQQSSIYQVSLDVTDASASCSVETKRPDGTVKKTPGLIRCGWVKGYEEKRITWQGHYVLEVISASQVSWVPTKWLKGSGWRSFHWIRVPDERQDALAGSTNEAWESYMKKLKKKPKRGVEASACGSQKHSGGVWRPVNKQQKEDTAQPQVAASSGFNHWQQGRSWSQWKVKKST